MVIEAEATPVRNKFVFFLPRDPRVCDFYLETRLAVGYVQSAASRPLDPGVPKNPWRLFDGQWLQRDFLLGDTWAVTRGGWAVWEQDERDPTDAFGCIELPSGRTAVNLDPTGSSWHQYRCDVFEPAVFPAFEEGLTVALERLSAMPTLPSEDEDQAVATLAELVHLGMGYDNPEVEKQVLWPYLDRIRADAERHADLKACGHVYAYLATRPYEEVKQVVDDCVRVARGEKAGQPRILPEEVPAVADLIRRSVPDWWLKL